MVQVNDAETATHSELFQTSSKAWNFELKNCSIWSGNKETEESEREKGEATKTVSVVEDSKIVKEKASETEKDEQGSTLVHEPESFNKNIDDSEKEKEDDIIRKPEEVFVYLPWSLNMRDAQSSLRWRANFCVLFYAGNCRKTCNRRRSNRNQTLIRTRGADR